MSRIAALRSRINQALDEFEGDVATQALGVGTDAAIGPEFDALGRTRWPFAEAVLAQYEDELKARNSRYASLFYFGDVTPPGATGEYAYDHWSLNTESMYVHGATPNQAYVFVRNADGQMDQSEAMIEENGHTPTACFLSVAEGEAHLRTFLARELGLDPNAINSTDFYPGRP